MHKIRANDVLREYWDGSIPVDVISIAQKIGIDISADESLNGFYSGKVSRRGDSFSIVYNPLDSENRQRFTVAHELGHIFLDHMCDKKTMFREPKKEFTDTKENFTFDSNPIEQEANNFAMELLMPSVVVVKLVQEGKAKSIEFLCALFNVSKGAMMYRLKSLGYLND